MDKSTFTDVNTLSRMKRNKNSGRKYYYISKSLEQKIS
ncbi:hypothetical protein B834_1539 [Enterococcus mundtii 1A]|nr:hypothetical protein [Enterococcus mundtii 1A]